jgi:predicted cupin superfamily sugar epimerase
MILSEKSATFRDHALTAADIIRLLELTPHPEGGHFRETFRDDVVRFSLPRLRGRVGEGARAASTAIYFLANARIGIASTPRSCGIFTRARRSR